MTLPYAEVIGDPVAHSKSPAIHQYWLSACGIRGDYRATRVNRDELSDHFARRRADPAWRGCNITMPHKLLAASFVDLLSAGGKATGAINRITRAGDGLIGSNSDIDGIAEALAGIDLAGARVALIGAGGGARAALYYLGQQGARSVTILVRDPARAAALVRPRRDLKINLCAMEAADGAIDGARLIINASPMGMAGAASMPASLLSKIASCTATAALFDMVYAPIETEFLKAGRAAGASTIDGLAMLIGQARSSFTDFFGTAPPLESGALRSLLLA